MIQGERERHAEALVRRHCFLGRESDCGTRERIEAAVLAFARALLEQPAMRFSPLRPGGMTDEQFVAFVARVRERVQEDALAAQVAEFARFEAIKVLGPGAA